MTHTKTIVAQITISDATYAKLLRVGEITQQDPQAWADAILARSASEVIKAEGAARHARRSAIQLTD
jgi:hypothetical protein